MHEEVRERSGIGKQEDTLKRIRLRRPSHGSKPRTAVDSERMQEEQRKTSKELELDNIRRQDLDKLVMSRDEAESAARDRMLCCAMCCRYADGKKTKVTNAHLIHCIRHFLAVKSDQFCWYIFAGAIGRKTFQSSC